MTTLVIQSFRTTDIPQWMQICMNSVKEVAVLNGWYYEFKDDSFLNLAPTWAKDKCKDNIFAVTDLCRLQWAKNALATYDKVVWFDADVLVFRPSEFKLTDKKSYGFAHEILILPPRDHNYAVYESVNNSVMYFTRGSKMLELYWDASVNILRKSIGTPSRCALGPELLQRIPNAKRAPLYGVGLFTYEMMQHIANGRGKDTLEAYEALAKHKTTAANLCHFMRSQLPKDSFDALYDTAVNNLLEAA